MPITGSHNAFDTLIKKNKALAHLLTLQKKQQLQALFSIEPERVKTYFHFAAKLLYNKTFKAIVEDELSGTEKEPLLALIKETAAYFPFIMSQFSLPKQIELLISINEHIPFNLFLSYANSNGFDRLADPHHANGLFKKIEEDFKAIPQVKRHLWSMLISMLNQEQITSLIQANSQEASTFIINHISPLILFELLEKGSIAFHELPETIKADPDFVKEYLFIAIESKNTALLEAAKRHIQPFPIDIELLKTYPQKSINRLICHELLTLPMEKDDLLVLKKLKLLSEDSVSELKTIQHDFSLVQAHQRSLSPFKTLVKNTKSIEQLKDLILEISPTVMPSHHTPYNNAFFGDNPIHFQDALHALYRIQARALNLDEHQIQKFMKTVQDVENEAGKHRKLSS